MFEDEYWEAKRIEWGDFCRFVDRLKVDLERRKRNFRADRFLQLFEQTALERTAMGAML